jgi:hypothetical protein
MLMLCVPRGSFSNPGQFALALNNANQAIILQHKEKQLAAKQHQLELQQEQLNHEQQTVEMLQAQANVLAQAFAGQLK